MCTQFLFPTTSIRYAHNTQSKSYSILGSPKEVLSQFDRNFNLILFSWNMWKVFQNQSQNNLTEQKERLKSVCFTYFSVQMSVTRTLFPVHCKSCFSLLFLIKSYHFDAFLFLIYMVSKLVYPNCTQKQLAIILTPVEKKENLSPQLNKSPVFQKI